MWKSGVVTLWSPIGTRVRWLINLVSKGKVQIELMVTGGKSVTITLGTSILAGLSIQTSTREKGLKALFS